MKYILLVKKREKRRFRKMFQASNVVGQDSLVFHSCEPFVSLVNFAILEIPIVTRWHDKMLTCSISAHLIFS